MGVLQTKCMYCSVHVSEKPDERPGNEVSLNGGICEACLTEKHPDIAPRLKIYRTCKTCESKSLKCEFVACDELSKRLDNADIEIRQNRRLNEMPTL
jgi:hypothetical protein